MKHLILQQFWDGIPPEKLGHVRRKLPYYLNRLLEERGNLANMPGGFYARRIRGTQDKYKFRIASGDRVIFMYGADVAALRPEHQEGIVLLAYCNHDEQIRSARRMGTTMADEEAFTLAAYDDSSESQEFGEQEAQYARLTLAIDYLKAYQVADHELARLAEEGVKDWQYYLNNEQYECVQIYDRPVFLAGGAGTGKSTVGLHKLLALSGNPEARLGYFTYTKTLRDDFSRLYETYRQEGQGARGEIRQARAEFHVLHEFCLDVLGLNSLHYIDLKRFLRNFCQVQWPLFHSTSLHKIDIWQEIRGLLKGYMGAGWDDDGSLPLLSCEAYLALPAQDCIFSREERLQIYHIATQYQAWLEREGKYDENDLARRIASGLKTRRLTVSYDYIMVDEVQDLTERQIYMLLLLKEQHGSYNNYFFSGDIHQMVNPTYFSFSRLRMPFHYRQTDKDLQVLEKNYRSPGQVVALSNRLGELCKTYIGAREYYSTLALQGPGAKPLQLAAGEENRRQLLDLVQRKDRQYAVIVVPDEGEKQRLRQICKHLERVFTVQEIKGLEYEYVVCVNMLTPFRTAWEEILAGAGRKNARYRYYFNIFYVAVTRARAHICLYEDDAEHPLLKELAEYLAPVATTDAETLQLERRATRKEIRADAHNQEKLGNYEQARKNYLELGDWRGCRRCEGKQLKEEGQWRQAALLLAEAGEEKDALRLAADTNDPALRLAVLATGREEPADIAMQFGKEQADIDEAIAAAALDETLFAVIYERYLKPRLREYRHKCGDCRQGIDMMVKEYS